MSDNFDIEKLQQSVKHCVLRQQYVEALSKINNLLDTTYLSDHEFIDHYCELYLHPASGAVTGGILGTVFLWPILMPIVLLFPNEGTQMMLMLLLAFCAIALGVFGGKAIAKKNTKAKAKRALQQYAITRDSTLAEKPMLIKRKQEYTQKLSELVTLMNNRENCIIPSKYWDYAPILISYIEDCRAHDLESAINVLEADLHRHAMEQKQFEILMEQREARILSEIAAENSIVARETAELAQINSAKALSEIRWQEFMNR